MPELPEVETTRRGIEPWLVGRRIERLLVREWRLRWRVPRGLPERIRGAEIHSVGRRAKYLLIATDDDDGAGARRDVPGLSQLTHGAGIRT